MLMKIHTTGTESFAEADLAKLIIKEIDPFTDTAAILNKLDLRVLWEAQGE